jgi:hypothetical protein
MSSLGSPNPFFIAGKKAYEVERSLRFNDDDTAYLSRNFGTGGNRKKWTFSAWIKRGNLGDSAGEMRIFGGSTNASHIYFPSNDEITWDIAAPGSSASASLNTQQKFIDPSAWFHLVCALDTDESTANNRMRMYINGTEVTSFGSRTNPSSGYALNAINADAFADGDRSLHTIGYRTSVQGSAGMEFDGYMAEINFIDGQQYDPSYFGETNPITGQWNPKKYVGGYGTTGFYLPLSDNSGTTATTLGKDSSGNGNNFTPNNFVTGDAVKDSPTNNFAVLRTHSTPEASGVAIAEGNLKYTTGSSGGAGTQNRIAISTFLPTSGKWYAEVMATSSSGNQTAGIIPYAVEESPTTDRPRYNIVNFNTGQILKNLSGSGTTDTYGASVSTNDVLCIYMDMDAKTVYYGKNGQWGDGSGSWNQSTPTSGSALGNSFFNNKTGGHEGFGISIMSVTGGASITCTANFGQDSTFAGTLSAGGNVDANGKGDFKYTVPANALAMCSANLPDPTILDPTKHFGTLIYEGNSSTQVITDTNEVDFTSDWVWVKRRDGSNSQLLFDSVRGVQKWLTSSQTTAEGTNAVFLTAFNNGGFTSGNNGDMNVTSRNYVAWNWNAGDTDGKTYTVTVVSDSGNKYRFDGFGTSAVTLDLAEGGTYIFNYPSAHPFRFSTTADGTHGGGSEYTTGVTVISSTSIQIVVAASAPTLYYYCSSHSGMGGAINTNSTLGSSNFDGSVQSTAKVNATAGFSIVTFSGSGNRTIGHGLGVAPKAIIMKGRNVSDQWTVGHQELDASNPWHKGIPLNTTATTQDNATFWNDTAPTSTVFHKGTWDDGYNMIAYCFSEVAGYSKFGSFTGNGNNDGPFIFLGFTPALIIYKNISSSQDWVMFDPKRIHDGTNLDYLEPNTNDSEGYLAVALLSNGFKLTHETNAKFNGSGNTFIYLAFAESPFKNARAR